MRNRFFAVGIAVGLVVAYPALAWSWPADQEVRLIVRGDDMGMTQGSLVAFERALNEGVLTCASIVVPGPWFEGAADLARGNTGWCTGIHLCLVGEWRGFRWRPVLPWDKVQSLVDVDGFLYSSPDALFEHKPSLQEIDAELRAQVNLAKRKGINVQYVDTHYVELDSYPGFDAVIRKIAKDYDVPISSTLGEKTIEVYATPLEQKKKTALQMLDQLDPGLWLWVCHIGIDSPEQRALIHTKPADIFLDGGAGVHRAEELQVLTSLDVRSAILKKGIVLTSYRELRRQR